MKKYFIVNLGCNDYYDENINSYYNYGKPMNNQTEFILELTDEELKTIIKFCDENNKVADYQCKPEIQIFEYEDFEEQE